MISREQVMHMLSSLLGFGRVTATKQATSTKQVLASVQGNANEERPYQALWGHAAILFRPPADTEVVFARVGDEMVPVASRDVRWVIDLQEGDVVVRALGADKPMLILRADGTCVLQADEIKLGDGSATEAIALGTTLKNYLTTIRSELETLRTAHNTHNHPTAPSGPVSFPSVLMPASFTSPPDIESRHKVEN